jgi:DinB superfamily
VWLEPTGYLEVDWQYIAAKEEQKLIDVCRRNFLDDIKSEGYSGVRVTTLEQILIAKAAYAEPKNIISGIPLELAVVRPYGLPHSLFEELWHIDYWLSFSLALLRGENPALPAHSSLGFPSDDDVLSETSWHALFDHVRAGLDAVVALARDETELQRLFRPDRTVRDELTVIATHNAYHFGRMVMLRQILGIWSSDLGDSW